jgi:hypothetical protein
VMAALTSLFAIQICHIQSRFETLQKGSNFFKNR